MNQRHKRYVWITLFLIILAAFTVRFANIETVPGGIYPDEAVNGTDAQEANATGQYKLFYESNNGREGLFINLQALSIVLLGNTATGLLIWSVIFGTLTVWGMYFLSRELFSRRIAGLTSAFLVAFAYWAINFSRIGFRAIMVPLILTWSFFFLFKGIRTKRYVDFIVSGLIFGLGVHTYISFRVSPLILIVLFCALIISKKDFLKDYWKQSIIFAIALFITALPMLLDFFYFHPEHYVSRTGQISVLNPEVNKGNLPKVLMETTGLALAKYNFWGDQNWRHNYPPYPLLNPLAGVAFFIGLIYIIIRFFHLLYLRFAQKVYDPRIHIYAFLLIWFFSMLIPEVLASEGNPHALRAIGTLPVVFLIATIPFIWAYKKINSFSHGFKIATISALALGFAFIAIFDTVKYHVFFANNPKQHESFEANLIRVSDYIRTLPAEKEKFIVTGSMQRVPIKYLNPEMPNLSYYYPGEASSISPKDNSNFEIIFTNSDWETINATRDRFPNISSEEKKDSFGITFYILKY